METRQHEKVLLPSPQVAIPAVFTFPSEENGRARKVVRRSNHGHVFKLASWKCGRMIELESVLEYDRAICLEMDPNVLSFQEQPFRVDYADQGVVHTIFPDLLVTRRNGQSIVEEIKPKELAALPEFRRRFSIEEMLVAKLGFDFSTLSEVDIRTGSTLRNSRKLRPYRRFPVDSLLREAVLDCLRKGPVTASSLLTMVKGLSSEALLVLVAHGHVSVDLSVRLSAASMISLLQ